MLINLFPYFHMYSYLILLPYDILGLTHRGYFPGCIHKDAYFLSFKNVKDTLYFNIHTLCLH